MKIPILIIFSFLLLFVAGCQGDRQVCPTVTGTPQYISLAPNMLATPTPGSGPIQVEIGRKMIQADKIIQGPLCNDNWSGTVYVTCDVEVYPWEEHPTFLKNCKLNIDPDTVVYVADHNNAAYYNGCSCHTGITNP